MLLGRDTLMLEEDPEEEDDRTFGRNAKNCCKMQRRSMEAIEEGVPDSIT